MQYLTLLIALLIFASGESTAGPPWTFEVKPEGRGLNVTVELKGSGDDDLAKVLVIIPKDQYLLKDVTHPIADLDVYHGERKIFGARLGGTSAISTKDWRYIFTVPRKDLDSTILSFSTHMSHIVTYRIAIGEFVRVLQRNDGDDAGVEKQTGTAEQASTRQPATRPESKSEGSQKPQPEAEGRSR